MESIIAIAIMIAVCLIACIVCIKLATDAAQKRAYAVAFLILFITVIVFYSVVIVMNQILLAIPIAIIALFLPIAVFKLLVKVSSSSSVDEDFAREDVEDSAYAPRYQLSSAPEPHNTGNAGFVEIENKTPYGFDIFEEPKRMAPSASGLDVIVSDGDQPAAEPKWEELSPSSDDDKEAQSQDANASSETREKSSSESSSDEESKAKSQEDTWSEIGDTADDAGKDTQEAAVNDKAESEKQNEAKDDSNVLLVGDMFVEDDLDILIDEVPNVSFAPTEQKPSAEGVAARSESKDASSGTDATQDSGQSEEKSAETSATDEKTTSDQSSDEKPRERKVAAHAKAESLDALLDEEDSEESASQEHAPEIEVVQVSIDEALAEQPSSQAETAEATKEENTSTENVGFAERTQNEEDSRIAEYEAFMAKAESFKEKGLHDVAALIFAKAAAASPKTGQIRHAKFEQMQCLVKSGNIKQAKALAAELRRSKVLTAQEKVLLSVVEGLKK